MLIHAPTHTKRGLPHLHRLPPSPHYLTWILYKINTCLLPEWGRRLGGGWGGGWRVLKLDQWRTEHHTNPVNTVTCTLTTFLLCTPNKKRIDRQKQNSGRIEKKNHSTELGALTSNKSNISYLSIPSHSSATPARGGLNMRGRRARPLLFCHVVCGKHMDCLVAFLRGIMRGPAAVPGEDAPSSQWGCNWIFIWAWNRDGINWRISAEKWDLLAFFFSEFACFVIFFFCKVCV